ncbi:MAG: MATE family efflux transporter [Actinomycetes bacterium]
MRATDLGPPTRSRREHDREILRLAGPALGALATEPLYVLVDTAIVGTLGVAAIGGLAVAGIVLTATFAIFNFLAYSTTAAVARRVGAEDRRAAAARGVDGMWLAAGLGLLLAVVGILATPWIVRVMGASAAVAPDARTYLRISLLGAPAVLLALAGAGYLRGLQTTRPTLWIALGANALNLVVEVVLVFGLHLGIAGSAVGTVLAQTAAMAVYLVIVGRSARATGARLVPSLAGMRATAVVGAHIVVRTASLLLALLTATAVAARISDTALAAHQIAFQVWIFLALTVDAIAIAGHAMVGRLLGADDPTRARTAARRMLEWGVVTGVVLGLLLALLRSLIVPWFTDDRAVQHLAEQVLLVVAVMQPVNAAVFVLDGVLIGAGDARYLAVAMAVASLGLFVPLALTVLALDRGLLALWAALVVLMVARLLGLGMRYRGDRWLVTGAERGRA